MWLALLPQREQPHCNLWPLYYIRASNYHTVLRRYVGMGAAVENESYKVCKARIWLTRCWKQVGTGRENSSDHPGDRWATLALLSAHLKYRSWSLNALNNAGAQVHCIHPPALKRSSVKVFLEEAVNAYTHLSCDSLPSSRPAHLLHGSPVLRSWNSEGPHASGRSNRRYGCLRKNHTSCPCPFTQGLLFNLL